MDKLKENIKRHYKTFCEDIGERHIGSDGEKKAVEYIMEEFKKTDIESYLEEYEETGWKYGEYFLKQISSGKELECFPCFYSNSCNAKGQLIFIEECDLQDIENMDLQNKICFLNVATDMGANVGARNKTAEIVDKKGAAALIVISNFLEIYNTKIVRNADLEKLCVVSVSGKEALKILKDKDAEYHIKVEAEKFQATSCNVIAKLPGKSPGKIVVGAHYDTAPGTAGACDNASGTAAMLELARLLKNEKLDWQIEFVAFGAEEYGDKTGSSVYVNNRKDKLDEIEFMCNLDDLGCPVGTLKTSIDGSVEFCKTASEVIKKHGLTVLEKYMPSGDNKFFYEAKVPSVSIMSDAQEYIQIHTPNDNLSKVCVQTTAKATIAAFNLVKTIAEKGKN